MILCRYFNSDRCLDIIKNQRLSAADPTTFNDPFEIKPGIIGKPDKAKTLRYFYNDLLPKISSATKVALPDFNDDAASKNVERDLKPAIMKVIEENLVLASKTLRIICFCDPNKINEGDDILLWSHYGDKHKGVRIFFETDDIKILSNNLFPVNYSFERPNFDITDPAEIKTEDAYRIIKTKNKSWKYEQEVRWIISLQECIQKDGRSYIPLSPNAIRRIDFGCKCESEKVIPLLKDDDNAYQHVKLYKALVHEHRYSLKYKEINNK
ncbi:MAG: DUF2971 domain-containing protein [Desulfobacterales bacterium]|nr:DUF2971 domain-containing protein [Desulfobacterales bacterium]